jgi:ERCC4-related helicase
MLRDFLIVDPESIIAVTGEISPVQRSKAYPTAQIIVITPQTLDNDLFNDRIDPKSLSLVCFDEAHRATGDYAYSRIVQDLPETCQLVGFTATPGNTEEAMKEVLRNLRSEKIVVRDYDSPDVRRYMSIHRPEILWVNLPKEYEEVLRILREEVRVISNALKEAGLDVPKGPLAKRDALALQKQAIHLRQEDARHGALLVHTANLIRTLHLLDLVETQGFPQALEAIVKWTNKRRSKALDVFLDSHGIKRVFSLIQANPVPHPKLDKLAEILLKADEDSDSRTIVFSNFRSTVAFLQDEISSHYDIPCAVFVGQSTAGSSKGMTQREQIETLEAFKEGNPPILISTSVGEEGLDVGSCDLVVFYDSVPSVIRSVQRTGRGRKKESKVIRLITKGTRDASLHYATLNRQRRVQEMLADPDSLLEKKSEDQSTLDRFLQPKKVKDKGVKSHSRETMEDPSPFQKIPTSNVLVLVDNREARSIVPRALKRQPGVILETFNLPAGDYAVSDRTCIERKTAPDFVESLISPVSEGVGESRLFDEIKRLSELYERPLIIVEGTWDQARAISEEAIQGAIFAIVVGFRVPILFTKNAIETAQVIGKIAQREQKDRKKPKLSTQISGRDDEEIREILLTTIPGVNRSRAQNLLDRFGSIQEIANSNEEELRACPGIGREIAKRLLRILSDPLKTNYSEEA